MEFCPECGAMMFPNGSDLKCNSCGYVKEDSDNTNYTVSKKIEAKETVTNLGEDVEVGPRTEEICPECGHNIATYKLLQTRSADEAPTRIFTCTKCKHTWRAYDWGLFMKDSNEKEHRISNLKDLIDNVKEDNTVDSQEDNELINYLSEDNVDLDELEIDDEFIYHPDEDKDYVVNLEESPIDEDFIIKTPKEEDIDEPIDDIEEPEDIIHDVSENFDHFVNAKIGRTPILAIISSVLGVIFIIISAIIFESRSDRVIDNVVSGETNFISVIVLGLGLLLLIYGIYKIFNIKNPLTGITDIINSIDAKEKVKGQSAKKEEKTEKVIPKSNIPLDKDSYKIGEFKMGDIKNKFKKSTTSTKTPTPITEDIDDIPPAREKEESKKGLTIEEIEDIEYKQAKLDNETIDDIFAEVEDIDEIPIISIDSEKEQ